MASRKKVLLKVLPPLRIKAAVKSLTFCHNQVIILGDSGVGKTSLMNQYVCGGRKHAFQAKMWEAKAHHQVRSIRNSARATRQQLGLTS